jgi:hypothetical protein
MTSEISLETITRLSGRVIYFEKSMRELGANFPFSNEVFAYKALKETPKVFRLFIIAEGIDKPFLETKLEVRKKYFERLPDFLDAFSADLKYKRQQSLTIEKE